MKKFNLKLITPLLLIFVLQGCMPDSLTKFKKEPAKKAVAAVAAPTVVPVDGSGNPVVINYPTVTTFNFTESNSTIALTTKDLQVDKAEVLIPGLSNVTNYGSLADPDKRSLLFVKCALNVSGSTLSQTLPPGMSFDSKTCALKGKPTVPYFDLILGVATNITYTFELYYKGANYTVAGTETKLTGTLDLGSYFFNSGVKDTVAIDYPRTAPTGFSYTKNVAGVPTAVGAEDFEVGTPVAFTPVTLGIVGGAPDGVGGTISSPTRSHYIFLKCEIDTTGPLSTRTLPPGLTLNADTCLIGGTPSAAFTDTTFGNMGGAVTYNIDMYYKGPNYLGVGTEVKVSTQMQLKAHVKPDLDPATWIAPTNFTFTAAGTSVSTSIANFEVGTAKKYNPLLDGTLSATDKFNFSFVSCALDATTPTLPTGLLLNTTTCVIGGTATALPATNPKVFLINMKYKDPTYTGPGTEQTIQASLTVGVYYQPTLLTYTQHDRLLFKLDSTTSLTTNVESVNYDRAGLLTSSNGVTGVIKFLDSASSSAGVIKVIPLTLASASGFVQNDFLYAAGGAIGKIQKVSGSIVYVERLTPASNFSAAEGVLHSATYPQTYAGLGGVAATTIASINSSYVFDMSITSLDNDDQFYSAKYSENTITRVYEKGVTITNITPIPSTQISALNGIVYSITPALPTGLSFDTTTGAISGAFTNTLSSTKFIVTATNPLGSTSFPMFLSSIEAPQDLSYSTRQLLTVSSNTSFNEGEFIFAPIVAPATENVTARLIRKYGTTQISITNLNGHFIETNSLDSGNGYYTEKATVAANPINYNVALQVSSTAIATVGSYVSSSSNAKGRVVAIDAGTKTVFIQYLNASATPIAFQEGDTISSGATYSASAVTIDQVESDNMKLTISAIPAALKAGDDLTVALAASPTVGDLGGYIHKVSGSDIYVSDISRRGTQSQGFRITQRFDNTESMATNRGAINAVANDIFFVVDRGIKADIIANVSVGTGLIYSVNPTLPAGLVLNSLTGVITGQATFANPRTLYTVTAKNLVNESKFVFYLESRDYFKLFENMGAPSALLHKYGDSKGSRKCRINSTDIKNFSADNTSVNGEALDIRCFLDAEEEDLHFNKLKLVTSTGSGVCEYIQVYPYSFWLYAPAQTAKAYTYHTGCTPDPVIPDPTAVLNAAPTIAMCDGNYSTDGVGPNCDEGEITVSTHTWTLDTQATPKCTQDATIVSKLKCAGKKSNCLKGPVRDILSDAEILQGSRSLLYSSSNGATVPSTFSAPIDNLDLTNLRVANGTVASKCAMTQQGADDWAAFQAGKSPSTNPFAYGTNPFYVVNCLDAAKDIKARIRVVVRDWNKTFKIKDAIDYDFLPGSVVTPLASATINNVAIAFGKSNNDYLDWDDDYAKPRCTNASYTIKSTCEGAGETWIGAYCSDDTLKSEASCVAGGQTWTSVPAVNGGSCAAPAFAPFYLFPEKAI